MLMVFVGSKVILQYLSAIDSSVANPYRISGLVIESVPGWLELLGALYSVILNWN